MTAPLMTMIDDAVAPTAGLVKAAADAPPTAPTPCADWDLHALVNHLLFWTPQLAAAGSRTPYRKPAPTDAEVDLVVGDWPTVLADGYAGLADAWRDPAAWQGTTTLDSGDPWPATMIGGMTVAEVVLHGWDLARTLGIEPEWPEPLLATLLTETEGMAPQGRELGIFGPEVPVPADASTLDRLVAASGRDPGWTP